MVMAGIEVDNTRVTLKHYVTTSPAVSDMEIKSSRISLSLHHQMAQQDLLVENLFLSPDPYMRSRMQDLKDSYFSSFIPGQVRISASLINRSKISLFNVFHTEVPLIKCHFLIHINPKDPQTNTFASYRFFHAFMAHINLN